MIKKSYSKNGNTCRVTFKFTPEKPVSSVVLSGEFNDWSSDRHPLTKRKDGSYSTTVSLPADQSYRFKYIIDGGDWCTDSQADGEEINCYGSKDSVIKV